MKTQIAAVCLFIAMSQSCLADQMPQQDVHATLFVKEAGGIVRPYAPWQFWKTGADKFMIRQMGNTVTTDVRLDNLARLQSAVYAIEQGYSYFSFAPTQHSLLCSNLFSGKATAVPFVNADMKFSKVPAAGLVEAKAVIAKLMPILSVDAAENEKNETYKFWTTSCISKSQAITKDFFKGADYGGISVHGNFYKIHR